MVFGPVSDPVQWEVHSDGSWLCHLWDPKGRPNLWHLDLVVLRQDDEPRLELRVHHAEITYGIQWREYTNGVVRYARRGDRWRVVGFQIHWRRGRKQTAWPMTAREMDENRVIEMYESFFLPDNPMEAEIEAALEQQRRRLGPLHGPEAEIVS